MRILSLSLSNWACHRSLEAELSRGLQIEGRNGTGKSSILKAVRFAFAETASGYRNRITNGERSAEVELAFTKDGKNYAIQKTLHVDKPSSAQLLCEGALAADNPSSVAAALKDMLPEDVLDNLLYVPQGEVTGIIDRLSQKGGRQELDALFGLDRLERVYRACGDLIKEAKTKGDVLAEQLLKYPEDAEKKYLEETKTLTAEEGRLSAEGNTKLATAEALTKSLNTAEKKIAELKRRKKGRDKLTEELGKTELSLSELTSLLNSLKKELEGLEEDRKRLSSLRDASFALLKYLKLRELLAGYNTLIERVRELSSASEEDAVRVKGLELALSGRKEAEDELKALSEEHGKLNNELIEAELSFERERKYLSDLTELKGKAKCPRCGQTLTSEHLSREVASAEEAIIAAKEAIGRVKAMEPPAKKKVEELGRRVEEFRNKEAELKNLKRALEKRHADKDKIQAELDRLLKELKERGYAGEKISEVEAKVSEYNNLAGKIELLEKRVSSEGEIREKLSAASDEYKVKSRRKEELMKELEGVVFDQDELDEAEKKKEELIERKYAVEGEVRELDFRLRDNKKKMEELDEKKREFLALKKEREESEARLHLLSRAREVFHTDKGLPKYLRDKYIKTLGLTLTSYFRRFNQNPAYKELFFDKDYGIRVKATHGELSVEQLSGGEKVQLAVALRIALIEMLSPIRLLILDEPFGSLDIEHRELLGETLNKMAAEWQLILVTHVHVDSLQLETMQLEGY